MRILMISTDNNIFDEKSDVRQRMIEYGRLAEELNIIIFTKKGFKSDNIGNVFLYPTNSGTKFCYIFDAIKIGRKIIENWKLPRPPSPCEVKAGGKIENCLIVTQDPFETGFVGWRLAKRFKLPWQAQIHTDFLGPYFGAESMLNKIRVWMGKFLIKRADGRRVVSERIKSSLVASGYSLVPIYVLPVFVDAEKIKNAPIKTDLRKKYPQFYFIILMASRLTKEKNIVLAISAISEVVKQYPKTGLIIVGGGQEQQNLKSQISNLKIDGNVKIENWTDDLSSYYKTADLFLLTSNYEGYGRTLIEAAAGGCGIISSDVGVADEILPRENIFETGNKEQLKEKIIKAIKGELKMSNIGCLTKLPTKEQYLKAYKKSWQSCELAE